MRMFFQALIEPIPDLQPPGGYTRLVLFNHFFSIDKKIYCVRVHRAADLDDEHGDSEIQVGKDHLSWMHFDEHWTL